MEANKELTSELIDEISAYARRTAPLSGSSVAAIQDACERYYVLATRHANAKLHLLQQDNEINLQEIKNLSNELREKDAKMSLLQQEYDKLKGENERLGGALNQSAKWLAGATAYAPYKERYEQAMHLLEDVIKGRIHQLYKGAISEQDLHLEWEKYKAQNNLLHMEGGEENTNNQNENNG